LNKEIGMEMEVTFPGGARVDAELNGFVIKTDQPWQGGGESSAPTPFALFLASIGTCAGIYVLGFCRQRNIATDGIRIRQRMTIDPMTRLVRKVNLDIDLPADFPARYAPALIKSAELCAVKKHLEHPPMFEIQTHIAEVQAESN
jgi:ribosomal protein S12 methylthiotransferase accessory factor